MTLKEMLAEVGPKTQDAFFDLLYKCNIRDLDFEFEQTLDLEVLAAETGPETMPAAHLANIMLRVHDAREKVCLKDLPKFADALYPANRAPILPAYRLTFNELAKNAREFSTFAALRRLAVKVGNKHSEIGLDTKIDVEVLAAGTGPETMSLLTLVILLTGIPGFVVIVPTLQALFSGDNPFWNMLSIPLGGICFGLAKKRVGE